MLLKYPIFSGLISNITFSRFPWLSIQLNFFTNICTTVLIFLLNICRALLNSLFNRYLLFYNEQIWCVPLWQQPRADWSCRGLLEVGPRTASANLTPVALKPHDDMLNLLIKLSRTKMNLNELRKFEFCTLCSWSWVFNPR